MQKNQLDIVRENNKKIQEYINKIIKFSAENNISIQNGDSLDGIGVDVIKAFNEVIREIYKAE